jgi:Na+(H+)/acetate symporter ActP
MKIYRKDAYGGYGMDNLTLRRWLAFAGIAIITAGMIGIVYGIFKNDYVIQLLGLACVVIAYLISVQVRRLRKANEAKDNE